MGIKIVGIRFKPAGKIYDFDPGAFVLQPGDTVIVNTDQGLGFGTVASPVREVDTETFDPPLKEIYRLAGPDDFVQREANAFLEKQACAFCRKEVDALKLDMNLFSVESTFDAGKLTFFFTAENRVDFRQLVKNLVKEFRVRIEMRQVGIRNQAKMLGGIGRCGRELCCSSYLDKFEPVSIRMAKEQGLSLNPTKISGLCGRLMCCLTYENETYKNLKKNFPKMGKPVETDEGTGKVIRHNVLAGTVSVRLEDGKEIDRSLKDVRRVSAETQQPTPENA